MAAAFLVGLVSECIIVTEAITIFQLSLNTRSLNRAAHLSLGKESRQRIYSLQGCYTGPTATNRPVKLKVTSLRETRAFATRLVMVSQEVDGEERGCLSCIVDFYSSSGNEVLKYSAQPSQKVTHHSELMEITELHRSQVKQGVLSQVQADRVSGVTSFANRSSQDCRRPIDQNIEEQNKYVG